MISHAACDHESTSKARSACRKKMAGGEDGKAPRKKMGRAPREEKEVDSYGQTPRDRDKECDKCGVEKIIARGTDPVSGILTYVGERCMWYIKRSPDLTPLD